MSKYRRGKKVLCPPQADSGVKRTSAESRVDSLQKLVRRQAWLIRRLAKAMRSVPVVVQAHEYVSVMTDDGEVYPPVAGFLAAPEVPSVFPSDVPKNFRGLQKVHTDVCILAGISLSVAGVSGGKAKALSDPRLIEEVRAAAYSPVDKKEGLKVRKRLVGDFCLDDLEVSVQLIDAKLKSCSCPL